MESIRSQQAEAQARLKSAENPKQSTVAMTSNSNSGGISSNQNNKTLQLSLKPNLAKYDLPSPAKTTAGKKSTVASSVVSADASSLSKQKKGNTKHTTYHTIQLAYTMRNIY